MQKFYELIELPPIRLFRKELLELESILKSDLPYGVQYFKASAEFGPQEISADNIETLLRQSLPDTPDRFNITVCSRNKKCDTDTMVSLTMARHYIHCQIHAVSESLFFGKRQQIERFFKRCKPWYALITKTLHILVALLMMISIFVGGYALVLQNYIAVTFAGTFFVSTIIMECLASNRKIFPYAAIYFRERKGWRYRYEIIVLIINILLLIATILSIVISICFRR